MEDKINNILLGLNLEIPLTEDIKSTPCITYHFYSIGGALFGSGTATEEGASCQVDIWYKVKTDAIKTAIKAIKQAIINEKYFSYPIMESTYETATKIYHTYFNFEILETEV